MRLIDADALTAQMEADAEHMEEPVAKMFTFAAINDIKHAPTIEPKKGKWIKARGSWCTPGGDPVWECSECGKGIHVYGIEHGTYGADIADGQWVACPNCGARMENSHDSN